MPDLRVQILHTSSSLSLLLFVDVDVCVVDVLFLLLFRWVVCVDVDVCVAAFIFSGVKRDVFVVYFALMHFVPFAGTNLIMTSSPVLPA